MNQVVAIVGPTATGKTETAIHLAQKFDGEIVNADSRQVYRFMDIGTAKPTAGQQRAVRHHLIDIINPDQDFSLALFQELALKAIDDIRLRGRLPVLAGGTGLYVWAVLEGWQIPLAPAEKRVRASLEERARAGPAGALFEELSQVDPESARAIGPTNVRRIIRALEVYYVTGSPASKLKGKQAPGFQPVIVGLTMPRRELYRRIDRRVDGMIESGLVEETRFLLDRGYSPDLPSMSGIGYREISEFLKGRTDLSSAVARIKYATHNFARRQYAWFRPGDKRIRWSDVSGEPDTWLPALVDFVATNMVNRHE